MQRHLYLTFRSPYARKIQILLAEKGLEVQTISVDLQNKSKEFQALGPIAKVPVLVDGDVIVSDSTVIAEYLEDRYPEPAMYGQKWQGRLRSRHWEELGDSLGDAAIAVFMGREAIGIAKAQGQLDRILATLETDIDQIPTAFEVAHASLISGLGYVSFRLGDAWKEQYPHLSAWVKSQESRPSVAATVPHL